MAGATSTPDGVVAPHDRAPLRAVQELGDV